MRLPRISNPGVVIAAATCLGIASMALVDARRSLPGALSSVHEAHPDLAGGRSCAACHGGWGESMGQACLECHALIDEQLESGRGLHGALGRAQGEGCAACHSEHHGAGFKLVNRRSFAGLGVKDPLQFDHARIGYEMAGEHLKLECAECHPNADIEVLPEGELRYLGLGQDCALCHEDPHEGGMQRTCESCHDQTSFDQLAFVRHDERLALVGGHAGLDCRACHAEGDTHSLEALGAPHGDMSPRACIECHPSPHGPGFLEGNAQLAGTVVESGCVDCHEAEHENFRAKALSLNAAQHAPSGFRLDAPHDALDCAACHGDDQLDFADRFPGRSRDGCAHCHEDPHEGQFAPGPFGRRGCVACHERTHFSPHAFSTEQHAQTDFLLDGQHLELECAACHDRPHEDGARRFSDTSSRCADCHEDAHLGFFEQRAFEVQAPAPQDCGDCHDTLRFARVPKEGFDHGRWTGFPVRGAHEQEGCLACHVPHELPDERGRRFGFVAEHFGEIADCGSCHEDPHAGSFDLEGLPKSIEGRASCARCHTETSFRSLPHGFDHGEWTGFALDGTHAEANCAACHPTVRAGGELRRGPAAGTACVDCHSDPHAGQFEERGKNDCARCHEATTRFADLRFDHDRDTRFELDEAHAALDCGACHRKFDHGDTQVARYRPLGMECAGCHGDQRQPLRRFDGDKR